jgi:hypothetical protein
VSNGRISGGHASLGQEHAPIGSRRRSSDDGERHNAMLVRPSADSKYPGQLAVVREPTGSVGRHRRSVMPDGDSDHQVSRELAAESPRSSALNRALAALAGHTTS